MIKIQVIGTGSAFSKEYFNTSELVTFPDGYKLLVDCGHSVPKGLHEQDISIGEIDGIFISHIHADHIGGLEEVAFAAKYVFKGHRIDLFVPSTILPDLWENSLKGGLKHDDEGEMGLRDYFNVTPVHPKQYFTCGSNQNFPMELWRTEHIKGKYSYALGIGGEVLFSCDAKFDKDLIGMAVNKYSVVFHDCQLFDGGVHASLNELLTLPPHIQESIILTHYGDTMESFRGKTGKMDFAEQGETISIYKAEAYDSED
jgi:mRNA degradation ribonuclease J1/J2